MTTSPSPLPESPPHALGYSSPFGAVDAPVWSNGKSVLTLDRAIFPARCIKCNGSDQLIPLIKKLAWSPPLMYLLLLFPGILIGGLIIILTQRKATISITICRPCRSRRMIRLLLAWGIFLLSIATFILAASLNSGLLALLGVLIFLTCLVYAIVATPLITAQNIRDNVVTLKGAGPAFLATLDLRR